MISNFGLKNKKRRSKLKSKNRNTVKNRRKLLGKFRNFLKSIGVLLTKKEKSEQRKQYNLSNSKCSVGQAVNLARRAKKLFMERLGLKSGKAFRKYVKESRKKQRLGGLQVGTI